MRGKIWIMIVGLVLVTVGAAAAGWVHDSAAAKAAAPGLVTANGRLEIPAVRVAAATGGRVLELRVRQGEAVRRGDTLAILDQRTQAAAAGAARAAVAAAKASVVVARGKALALESRLALARVDARRYRHLFERDAAPRQAAEQAEAAVAELTDELAAARAAQDLAREQTDVAGAKLRAAEVELDETIVTAPASGSVSEILTRQGEMAAPGRPVVALRRAGDVRLDVYLPLVDAERVRSGDSARVYVDAYGDRAFEGAVESIASAAEFTPRDIYMPDERTSLVYKVIVRIRDPDGVLKDGFPADVEIRWDARARWPEKRPWQS